MWKSFRGCFQDCEYDFLARSGEQERPFDLSAGQGRGLSTVWKMGRIRGNAGAGKVTGIGASPGLGVVRFELAVHGFRLVRCLLMRFSNCK